MSGPRRSAVAPAGVKPFESCRATGARSGCCDDVDAQRFPTGCDREQVVDVRVRTRTIARVGRVLGEHCEAVFG